MHIYISIICLECTLPIVAIHNSKIPICDMQYVRKNQPCPEHYTKKYKKDKY